MACQKKLQGMNGLSSSTEGIIQEEMANVIESFRSKNQSFMRSLSLKKQSRTSQARKEAMNLFDWIQKGTQMATDGFISTKGSQKDVDGVLKPQQNAKDKLLYLLAIINTAMEEVISKVLSVNQELSNVLRSVWDLHWTCFDWLVFGVLKESSDTQIKEELRYREMIKKIEKKIEKSQNIFPNTLKRGKLIMSLDKELQTNVEALEINESEPNKKKERPGAKKKKDSGTDCCYLVQVAPNESLDLRNLKENKWESFGDLANKENEPREFSLERMLKKFYGIARDENNEFETKNEGPKRSEAKMIGSLNDLKDWKVKKKVNLRCKELF